LFIEFPCFLWRGAKKAPAGNRSGNEAPGLCKCAWPFSFLLLTSRATSAAADQQARDDERKADDKPPQLARQDAEQEDDDAGERYVQAAFVADSSHKKTAFP